MSVITQEKISKDYDTYPSNIKKYKRISVIGSGAYGSVNILFFLLNLNFLN